MKHKVGDVVWVLGVSDRPIEGVIITAKDNRYDVRLGAEPPKKNEGFIVHSYLKEDEVHATKLLAARRMYQKIADRHHRLGRLLEESIEFYDDAELLVHKLGGMA